LPSGMIVVVGWMMVPLAERSTGCGVSGCFLAAAAGITVAASTAAQRPLKTAPVNGRTTEDMVPHYRWLPI
jgi:hypothetical protein